MVFSRELPHSFEEALKICRGILSANHDLVRNNVIDTEAEQLVIGAHRLTSGEKLSRAQFFLRIRDRYSETAGTKLLIIAGQRVEGVPLQYLLGWQVFLDHEYEVDSSTLVPRPETEILVQEAIQLLKSRSLDQVQVGFEIGIGSGVISIELLNRFPLLKMTATEISTSAAALARRNAISILGSADRLEILHPVSGTDVLDCLTGRKADFLISNPPYLDVANPAETETAVLKFEPKSALFPMNGDPLHFYREIAERASTVLRPGGQVFLEIAHERAEQVQEIFGKAWNTELVSDLLGRFRVLLGKPKEHA